MSIYGNAADDINDPEKRKQRAMEEERARKAKEKEEKDKEDQRRNLKRKISGYNQDLAVINTKMQTLKVVIKQLRSESDSNEADDAKKKREIEQLQRELLNQKAAVRRTEAKIDHLEKHRDVNKVKFELQQKEDEYRKLNSEHSDIDHLIMRLESELRGIR